MKKRGIILATVAVLCMSLTACDVFQSALTQANELMNLRNCEYNLKNVSNLTVANVNVKNLTNGKVSATDVLNLAAALTNKKVPLAMNVNIDVKNPTEKTASMTAMDWIMEIDGSQFANGTSSQKYSILKNTTTTVPLGVNTDLYSMFSKSGIESLKNFVGSFKSDGTSSKVGLKIKPMLTVGTQQISMPNYIKLEKKTGTSNS